MSGPRDDSLPFKFDMMKATFPLNETERALAEAIGVHLTEACQNVGQLRLKDSPANRAAVHSSTSSLLGAMSLLNAVTSRASSPGLRSVGARAMFAFLYIQQDVDSLKG